MKDQGSKYVESQRKLETLKGVNVDSLRKSIRQKEAGEQKPFVK